MNSFYRPRSSNTHTLLQCVLPRGITTTVDAICGDGRYSEDNAANRQVRPHAQVVEGSTFEINSVAGARDVQPSGESGGEDS